MITWKPSAFMCPIDSVLVWYRAPSMSSRVLLRQFGSSWDNFADSFEMKRQNDLLSVLVWAREQ